MASAEDHKKTDIEVLLERYSSPLDSLYAENGNPRTLEEKIIVLEKIVGICIYRCSSDREKASYLMFDYLCIHNFLSDDDQSSFSV